MLERGFNNMYPNQSSKLNKLTEYLQEEIKDYDKNIANRRLLKF